MSFENSSGLLRKLCGVRYDRDDAEKVEQIQLTLHPRWVAAYIEKKFDVDEEPAIVLVASAEA